MKAILISVVALTLVSCGGRKSEQTIVLAEPMSAGISITIDDDPQTDAISSATRANNRPTFNGILTIPPQYHATVTLLMDGVVKSTSLLAGKFVRKGELLATLEKPEFIALQQSYIENHAQEEFLEAEYRRQEILAEGEATSKKTLQQSRADYLSMRSRREAAAAQLVLLGLDPARVLANGIVPYLEVRSPIDGYVADVQINLGKHVAAGDPVCDIINKNMALLRLTVYEKDIGKINVGDRMEFRAGGLAGQVFEATVTSLGQTVDNASRSIEVYARVNEPVPQFRPGMYVNAQLAGE
ncbi:MAG: efflux RND transporter periplasmic adaptor subunit [Rikenellaceae bacterium]|nr:efflux RND transporter periplasmic adaptor subunit [Rikenellaceae bacterium]MCL2692720.1 efflux RND transporter periplasmic adaptor subunit [Rikenellaceae bacterium]